MIEVKNISFCYPNSKSPIFEGHNFSLKKSQVLAILGPNGSGKTTLIKTLLKILPISTGTIQHSGRCSYVPQHTASPFDYSVREMTVMGAGGQHGMFSTPQKQDYLRCDEALEKVGMLSFAAKSFTQLSGGQRQMVLIARALVSNPDIMILDEPTSALDYYNQNKVLQTIKELANQGKAVIFSTHCPLQALQVAHQVLLVKKDQQSIFGSASEILTSRLLTDLYQIHIARDHSFPREIIAPIYD